MCTYKTETCHIDSHVRMQGRARMHCQLHAQAGLVRMQGTAASPQL